MMKRCKGESVPHPTIYFGVKACPLCAALPPRPKSLDEIDLDAYLAKRKDEALAVRASVEKP
jgi:hypothetical protein